MGGLNCRSRPRAEGRILRNRHVLPDKSEKAKAALANRPPQQVAVAFEPQFRFTEQHRAQTSITHAITGDQKIVWTVTDDDVNGVFRDTCGAQRLSKGNTVIGSHDAKTGISMVEVTPDKRVVWTSDHPFAARIHHLDRKSVV